MEPMLATDWLWRSVHCSCWAEWCLHVLLSAAAALGNAAAGETRVRDLYHSISPCFISPCFSN